MQGLSKILGNFTDRSGHIDIRYLSNMRRIETGSSVRIHNEDIEDLFFIDLFSDELNRIRFVEDQKSEKEKTRKIIKQIFPKMQIVN